MSDRVAWRKQSTWRKSLPLLKPTKIGCWMRAIESVPIVSYTDACRVYRQSYSDDGIKCGKSIMTLQHFQHHFRSVLIEHKDPPGGPRTLRWLGLGRDELVTQIHDKVLQELYELWERVLTTDVSAPIIVNALSGPGNARIKMDAVPIINLLKTEIDRRKH